MMFHRIKQLTCLMLTMLTLLSAVSLSGCDNYGKTTQTDAAYPYTYQEYPEEGYATLYEEYNALLKEKDFPQESMPVFEKIFQKYWRNYDGWRKMNPELPNKTSFLRNFVFNAVRNIKTLNLFLYNSEDPASQARIDSGEFYTAAMPWTGEFSYIWDEAIDDLQNPDNIGYFIYMFVGLMNNCFTSSSDFVRLFDNEAYEYLYPVLTDGAAAEMELCSYPVSEKQATATYYPGESYDVVFNNECVGQNVMNYYANLEMLVGFDLINRVRCGDRPASAIRDALCEGYGEENAETILSSLKDLYDNAYNEDQEYYANKAVEVENAFCECVRIKAQALSNSQEVEDFVFWFRTYQQYYLAQIERKNDEFVQWEKRYQTESYYPLREIRGVLARKAVETGAFRDIEENDVRRKELVRQLAYFTKNEYEAEETYSYELPGDLTNVIWYWQGSSLHFIYRSYFNEIIHAYTMIDDGTLAAVILKLE